ncbi:hypothetical protein M405DRAFT_857875 [Rhizopogon salebrosus TDB-379]|nr:hypothetical protein M405DRAFT_857875 [Rhizopogon salebrosus TDB-379]
MSIDRCFDPDNCALDAQGKLKDADDIQFYNSEGDDAPIASSSTKGNAKADSCAKITALKKSGVLPAEVISGRRQVRPSKKAKAAAGIYSGEDEPESDLDDIGPIKIGTKRKSKGFKNTSSSLNKKQKGKEALVKKTHTHRKATNGNSDSLDGALANEDENCHEDPDEADAYEQLRVQRDKDRPLPERRRSTRGNDACTADVRTVFTPDERMMPDGTLEKGHWCEASKGRKALADRWYIDSQETHRPKLAYTRQDLQDEM